MQTFSTTKWDLHPDVCPCDVHFNEWAARERLADKTIYHFGTGTHHVIGRTQAENGSGNRVFGITASREEYDSYAELVTANPRVAKNYVCYFGDIYLTNTRLLPRFDVINLFHLCEFYYPEVQVPNGGLDDAALLDGMTALLQPGGSVLFYTGSKDADAARPVIAAWEKAQAVERVGEFKTLLVYRKR